MRKEENKPAEPERKITMGSLFDGIGGFPLAAVRNGIEPVWASEIEAFPIAVSGQCQELCANLFAYPGG